MQMLVVIVAGVLFAAGLAVGGMTDPSKVVGFLDLFGDWDPSLAFVMGGAVGLNLLTFRYILRRPNPLLAPAFSLPSRTQIDARLLFGAALFGVGWGIAGLCPGPAVVSLATGSLKVLGFFGAMAVGALVHDRVLASR